MKITVSYWLKRIFIRMICGHAEAESEKRKNAYIHKSYSD